MSVPIPADFDYLKEELIPTELIIRDVLRLKVENWVKFRHTIAVGTEAWHLKGTSVSDDAKDAYLSLGKCHYEVVCSLGYTWKAFYDAWTEENYFLRGKAIKDFYFHGGALLDILSRIVFVINVPDSHSSKDGRGKYRKHLVDRGKLLKDYKPYVTDYIPLLNTVLIQELVNVRNSMAHYWSIPNKDGIMWPRRELKTTKAFAWPYSEADFHNYSDWQPIPTIMKEHFTELERVQNEIFGLLIRDIPKFEKSICATII